MHRAIGVTIELQFLGFDRHDAVTRTGDGEGEIGKQDRLVATPCRHLRHAVDMGKKLLQRVADIGDFYLRQVDRLAAWQEVGVEIAAFRFQA
ncbi:hypothetical protein D3C87_1491220 [compost metagenome]